LNPSHVLLALGQSKELAHGSLRITLGRWTSEEAVDKLLEVLPEVVAKVRTMSATYRKISN
jgi:cysteine desulfurase